MIQTYIQQLNDAIIAGLGQFEANIKGIAQPVYVIDEDAEIQVPYITTNGEDQHVFIDDDYDFGLYHKQRGVAYIEDFTKGFGDKKRIQEAQDLSIIAWGFESRISAEELKDYILTISPDFVRFVSVSFDKKAIFNAEFKGIEFMVNECIFLIQINYKVQYDVKKSCLEINSKFNI